MKTKQTPFLPPEWAPQSGVMLTWPHRESYWADTLEAIDAVFTQTAFHIAKNQQVLITCYDAAHEIHVKTLLVKAGVNLANVRIHLVKANDIWVRDHGPLTVIRNDQPLLLDFTFTGWGYKYPAENDNRLTRELHLQKAFGLTPLQGIELALEGGAIEVDGQGTLLTTRSCVLSKKRNPSLSEEEIAACLQGALGVNRILWLHHGALEGDDTDGHIDTIARFTDPHTICYVRCTDSTDPHFATFQAMEEELRQFTDYQGNPYRLIPLPWPEAQYADVDQRRLPLTYANFLILNQSVLVPTYEDPADEEAIATLADCFPDREIIGIHALPVVQWYGGTHCMTMQLPRGVLE